MLTRQQHDLLVFIDRFTRENGWAPSYDEMRTEMGFASKSGIARLMAALIERGFIAKRFRNRVRAIEVIRMPGDVGPQSGAGIAATKHELLGVIATALRRGGWTSFSDGAATEVVAAIDAAGLTLVRKP